MIIDIQAALDAHQRFPQGRIFLGVTQPDEDEEADRAQASLDALRRANEARRVPPVPVRIIGGPYAGATGVYGGRKGKCVRVILGTGRVITPGWHHVDMQIPGQPVYTAMDRAEKRRRDLEAQRAWRARQAAMAREHGMTFEEWRVHVRGQAK